MPKPESSARKKKMPTIQCRKRVYTGWRSNSPCVHNGTSHAVDGVGAMLEAIS